MRALLQSVLEEAESAAQDGHVLPVLQCLLRLLPDAVLSDACGASPGVGKGVLGEETVDEVLLNECLAVAEVVALQFLQEGRVKGFYAGGDWPQQSRTIIVAFLRASFHPRIWAVRAAHTQKEGAGEGAGGALFRRWVACWQEFRESPRFIKLFATHTCVLWRLFPGSLLFYSR